MLNGIRLILCRQNLHGSAFITAAITESLLNCINQMPDLMNGEFLSVPKLELTYLVPNSVSAYSSVMAILRSWRTNRYRFDDRTRLKVYQGASSMSVPRRYGTDRQILASLLSGVLLWCPPLLSHEFWLQPETFVLPVGETFRVALKNGERLEGASFPYVPDRFERFDVVDSVGVRTVQGRLGDDPAAVITARVPGLMTLIYQSTPNQLVYADWAAFERFAEEEDVAWLLDAHLQRGLPMQNVTEQFFRYSKLVTWASDGKSDQIEASDEKTEPIARQEAASNTNPDTDSGLRFELVLQSNPYLRSSDEPVNVQLMFEGMPVADTQISVFHKAESGVVSLERVRVDGDGQLQLQVASEGWYLLSAVMVEASMPEVMLHTGAVWQSLWASLVFGPSLQSATR